MRHYLIIGSVPATLQTAISFFEQDGEFNCVGRIEEMAIMWHEILGCPPEFVLVNLDDPNLDVFKIISLLNHKTGIIPNYIGLTSCHKTGFKAFRAGFVDVLAPRDWKKILNALYRYKFTYSPTPTYCIVYYQDFRYLKLSDVILIKADNYTTEFLMSDGSVATNFKNLKHTHRMLPLNFQRISRSYVVNSHYVSRIHTGKDELYLRHYGQPLRITKKYSGNIVHIKEVLSETWRIQRTFGLSDLGDSGDFGDLGDSGV